MPTVRELREHARELGIKHASRMRKAELLAAVTEAARRLAEVPASTSEPTHHAEPSTTAVRETPARKHPHAGVGPLLGPLALPALPAAHEVRHLAVLPRSAGAVVVVWSLTAADWARGPLALRLWCEDGPVATARVGERLGTWVAVGLRPDQHVWAEILAGSTAVAASRRIALPPDAPARLHHPLLVRVAVDRPLHELPPDLRAGAPGPAPRGRTASERAWARAVSAPAGERSAARVGCEPPALLPESGHEALVSSFVHAGVR